MPVAEHNVSRFLALFGTGVQVVRYLNKCEEVSMGKINVPASAQISYEEQPYHRVQVIPDRITYTVAGISHNILKGLILGDTGFNSQIQEYLETLEKTKAVDMNGRLYKAWLKYHSAATGSPNLSNDPTMMAALQDFQRLACVGSSYKKLPSKAAKAAFWEQVAEVPLPRITQQ